MTRTAIIAGTGALPRLLAEVLDAPAVFALEGFSPDIPAESFRLERLVPLLEHLLAEDVSQVVFAGAVRRPRLDPEAFDPRTATLVPRIAGAMAQGDDAALRELIAIVEEWGLPVVGVEAIRPDLIPPPGFLAGSATAEDRADADRAAVILAATGGLDIGQGCVVSGGLCLAIETLPGTAAMLDFVARHRDGRIGEGGGRRGGVLVKAPKPGQDRRIDLPAIGPDTVTQARDAGLSGIAWPAGGVLVLESAATIAAAKAAGVFLWAREQDDAAV